MGTVGLQVASGREDPGATELPHRVGVAAGNAASILTPRAAATPVPSPTQERAPDKRLLSLLLLLQCYREGNF